MSYIKKIQIVLLIGLIMQVYMDETLAHFDLNGRIHLRGDSSQSSNYHHFQQNHDHLWIFSSASDYIKYAKKPANPIEYSYLYALPELIRPIWQPPKSI